MELNISESVCGLATEIKYFGYFAVKEVEFLDWNARTRIIMGTAYCLQYMHHDLNPPVAHPNLHSTTVYLTDDYAAKVDNLFSYILWYHDRPYSFTKLNTV